MGKKLIRIKTANWIDDLYINYSKALNFAFVGPDEETDAKGYRVRTQVSKFVGCREILCKDARAYAHEFDKSSSQTNNGYPADMETLRLLITVTGLDSSMDEKEARKRVFAGKRALNLFEEYGKFSSQSVISTVKHLNDKYKYCWLLTAPKEWISTPQLLSFATLVLRTSYHIKGGLNTDSLDDLMAHVRSFKQSGNKGVKRDSDADCDLGRWTKLEKHILRVFDVRDKLFFSEITEAYDPNGRFTDYGYGGIDCLFSCATGQRELNNKFKNLVLKPGKKAVEKKQTQQ